MKPSNSVDIIIKVFEGLRLQAYDDGTGVWTIGYGHTGPEVRRGSKITLDKALALLRADIGLAGAQVLQSCPEITQPQLDALTSLVFNIGPQAFRRSTLRRLHNEGDYAGAEAQFGRWVNAGGKKLDGLVRRRKAEARLYHAGSIQQ